MPVSKRQGVMVFSSPPGPRLTSTELAGCERTLDHENFMRIQRVLPPVAASPRAELTPLNQAEGVTSGDTWRLLHTPGGLEVPSSNLGAPTEFPGHGQLAGKRWASFGPPRGRLARVNDSAPAAGRSVIRELALPAIGPSLTSFRFEIPRQARSVRYQHLQRDDHQHQAEIDRDRRDRPHTTQPLQPREAHALDRECDPPIATAAQTALESWVARRAPIEIATSGSTEASGIASSRPMIADSS